MTTKPLGRSFRIKDGKLVRVTPFRASIKKRKAEREAKAWKGKSK